MWAWECVCGECVCRSVCVCVHMHVCCVCVCVCVCVSHLPSQVLPVSVWLETHPLPCESPVLGQ